MGLEAGSSGKEVGVFKVMSAKLWGPDLQTGKYALMCILSVPCLITLQKPLSAGVTAWRPWRLKSGSPHVRFLAIQPEGLIPRHQGFFLTSRTFVEVL